MSNIFRDSESLGKSNGKKWCNIWTVLFWSGLKLPRKKKVFFLLILPWSTLLWHRCYYPHRSRNALSPVCGIFSSSICLCQFKLGLLFIVMTKSQNGGGRICSEKTGVLVKLFVFHFSVIYVIYILSFMTYGVCVFLLWGCAKCLHLLAGVISAYNRQSWLFL